MNDPGKLDISDWFSAIFAGLLTAVLGGLGTFALFFKNSKQRIYDRITAVEKDIKESEERHVQHHAELVELRANQVNTADKLNELKSLHKDTVTKLESTIEKSANKIEGQLKDLMRELRTKT